jgi:outer membrane protein assembly factor BamA
MLAIIIGFLSLFTNPGPSGHANSVTLSPNSIVSDSLKRPAKNRIATTDTTRKFVQINRIFLVGNRITRDQIILRELSVKPGDIIYSSDLAGILDLDKKKLINTRLFNTVEIKIMELDAKNIDLVVDLNERWYTFPSPIFELADRNFNDWWQNYGHDFRRVNYGLRLYQYNMRGRNETLRLHAQFGFQRKFELLYRFPYIDKKQKHGLSLDLGYLETKNLAAKTFDHRYVYSKSDNILKSDRVAGLTYSYRKSFYKTHSAKIEYRKTHIADTVKSINPLFIKGDGEYELEYTSFNYQFNADHRDFFAYPLKGFQFAIDFRKTGLLPNDDVNKWEGSILYSRYLDLTKEYYLSNNTVLYASTPDDLSYVNFSALGMRKQFVRGYEIYVIEGPMYALNKTTLKKKIFSNTYHWSDMPIEQFRHIPLSIYFKTYFDMGMVENYPDYELLGVNTQLADKLIAGGGFGFDIVGSYDIVLRLEYSFNVEGGNGFFFHLKKEF